MPDQEAGWEIEAATSKRLLGRDLWLIDLRTDNPEYSGQSQQLTNDPGLPRRASRNGAGNGQFLLFPRLDATDNASLWLAPGGLGESRSWCFDSLAI